MNIVSETFIIGICWQLGWTETSASQFNVHPWNYYFEFLYFWTWNRNVSHNSNQKPENKTKTKVTYVNDSFSLAGAEQYRSDCDIKSATNGTENLLYKHQNMDSPNSVNSRSPLQMRQASPFPLESTNRRYVTAAAPNPQDRHRSSGK